MIKFIVLAGFMGAGCALFFQWAPLVASLWKREDVLPGINSLSSESPVRFVVGVPSHNGASCLPSIIKDLKRQSYDSSYVKIVVLADNCEDDTAAVARSLGVAVFERRSPNIGKGQALNDWFQSSLKQENFDALVLFDVDARIESDFLRHTAAHIAGGKQVLQGRTEVLNNSSSPMAKVGGLIQAVIRSHQQGRARLGWAPLLIGSHGIVITRPILEKLNWTCATVKTGDDLELSIRFALMDVPVHYAGDLIVRNEVPEEPGSLRRQRRRWSYSSMELGWRYSAPLLWNILKGSFRSLDMFLGHLWAPSFSVLYLFLVLFAAATAFLVALNVVAPWVALGAVGLLALDTVCLSWALHQGGERLHRSDLKPIVVYLGHRAVAFLETVFLGLKSGWYPTPHGTRE